MTSQYDHPACYDNSRLLAECEISRSRAGGPGGQHRNKVETAVSIHHIPTGVTAAASERRSQAKNKKVALKRLRLNLAITVRRPITLSFEGEGIEGDSGGDARDGGERIGDSCPGKPEPAQTGQPQGHRQTYQPGEVLASRIRGGKITVSAGHRDFPGILAEVLDVVAACRFDVKRAGEVLNCSMTQVLKLVKLSTAGWGYLNEQREKHGLRRLR